MKIEKNTCTHCLIDDDFVQSKQRNGEKYKQ